MSSRSPSIKGISRHARIDWILLRATFWKSEDNKDIIELRTWCRPRISSQQGTWSDCDAWPGWGGGPGWPGGAAPRWAPSPGSAPSWSPQSSRHGYPPPWHRSWGCHCFRFCHLHQTGEGERSTTYWSLYTMRLQVRMRGRLNITADNPTFRLLEKWPDHIWFIKCYDDFETLTWELPDIQSGH